MRKETIKIKSSDQKLDLVTYVHIPDQPKAIILFCHGMAEHKERYYKCIDTLVQSNYGCVINDERGHGESIINKDDLGYFYDDKGTAIVEDVYTINQYIKNEYPNTPIYIFGHSMGAFIVRNYLQKYDTTINKAIICGAPCSNSAVDAAVTLAKTTIKLKGEKSRSNLLQSMSVGAYDKPFKKEGKNAWLSINKDNVEIYNQDPLCGFTFTNNGFLNLFYLMKNCFNKDLYKVNNKDLPILFIAGQYDPVIGGEKGFKNSIDFLKNVGYTNIKSKLYPNLRHEILNENVQQVIADIILFYNN